MSNFATFDDKQASKLPSLPAQLPSTKPTTDALTYLLALAILAAAGYFVYRTFFAGTATAGTAAAPLPIPDSGDWMMDWKEWVPRSVPV